MSNKTRQIKRQAEQQQNRKVSAPLAEQKRGSAVMVGIVAACLLAGGLYIGGWFNLVTPAQIQQCEAAVRQAYPQPADQTALLPKCNNRHMIAGMSSPNGQKLSAKQVLDSLDVGKTVDLVSMFIGGALIGAAIAAFAASYRIFQRKRGKNVD
ncbi:hypothetical protein [Snodgrassella alvi]|uniref:Uncharacterized protein n=1 Tax=Snodgrassella alvi TaxID=1196083 RepID=A0A2N9WW45_9NEIS|nr:hypothetical protein [Snodgrassella alvi]PIT13902.1 hypothetical protein BGI33_09040 [Snodgrassella alvi]PIT17772.1 hypothetical protein BGI34_06580 [Snodgrassella alvi]PIT17797.1 hypothetical protein BGI32_01740 [Snodgrassella alvi]